MIDVPVEQPLCRCPSMQQFQRGNAASHRGEDGQHGKVDIIGDEDALAMGLATLEGHSRVCMSIQEMKELDCCHDSMAARLWYRPALGENKGAKWSVKSAQTSSYMVEAGVQPTSAGFRQGGTITELRLEQGDRMLKRIRHTGCGVERPWMESQ